MKGFILIIISLMIVFSSFAQTQQEMNENAKKEFDKKDKELNEGYQKIFDKYKDDTVFIKNLRICQRTWIQFRDAQMDMKFPKNGNYGSMFPLCWYSYEEELTDSRIIFLKEWIDGVSEHGCDGSVQ